MNFIYYSIFFYFFNFYLKKSSFQSIVNLRENSYLKLINYINSCIHAKIVYVLSFLLLMNFIDVSVWSNCLDVTRGYCFYDTLMILYQNPLDYQMLIHHLILFIGTYNYYVILYPYQIALALLSETSNQFLYIGWFLIKKNLKNTMIFKINGIILLILFFLFRVINFTYLSFFIFTNCSFYENILFLPITLLNYYWFFLLVKKF